MMSQSLRSSEEQGDITAESQENFLRKRTEKSGKIASSAKAGFVTFERSFIWCKVGGLAQV